MIPRILHQIWLSHDPLPDHFARYRQTWLDLHPHWEHRLWLRHNLPPLINQAVFEAQEAWVVKADILRIELILAFGGVYADLDTEALKVLDPLLDQEVLLAVEQPDNGIIGNAYLGGEAGHPFFRQAVEAVGASVAQHTEVLDKAGPFFLTREIRRYAEHQAPLNLMPGSLFFPYLWHQREKAGGPFPDAYAVHHWACSWR